MALYSEILSKQYGNTENYTKLLNYTKNTNLRLIGINEISEDTTNDILMTGVCGKKLT